MSVISSTDIVDVVEAWAGNRRGPRGVGMVAAASRHVLEGIDIAARKWALTGLLECGVEGCRVSMLDPYRTSWLLVFEPGFDVVPVCSSCIEQARTLEETYYVIEAGAS